MFVIVKQLLVKNLSSEKMSLNSVCIVASQKVGISIGGVENFVIQLSHWLGKKSIRTVVISNSPKKKANVKHLEKESPLFFSPSVGPANLLFDYFPPVFGSLFFSFLSFLMIIKLQKSFCFSIIHAQDTSYAALAAVLASKLLCLPVVLHSHGIELKSAMSLLHSKGLSNSLIAPIYLAFCLLLERILIKKCDHLILVSQEAKDYLLQHRVSIKKYSVIKVGVDLKKYQSTVNEINHQNLSGHEKTCVIFGFIGRLSLVKNLIHLIRAFAMARGSFLGKAKLLIIGDGPMRVNLEKETKRLGIVSDVTFLGERLDINRLLSEIDVFILPSFVEGSPTSLLEAMAAGKAIIASDIPSIGEIVRNGKEAILVNPYDIEELKQAILLLHNNPHLRETLSCSAMEKVKFYDFGIVFGKILRIYKELNHTQVHCYENSIVVTASYSMKLLKI